MNRGEGTQKVETSTERCKRSENSLENREENNAWFR